LIHQTKGFVARVEAPRHLLGRQHVDVGGQLVVQGVTEDRGRELRLEVEMGHLAQCVDSRVGAPRAVELEVGAPGDTAYGRGHLPLDRAGVLLDLPAAVSCADELDHELEAGHGRPP
jgi:hypothetical protein